MAVKLTYFGHVAARGFPIRLALRAAGVPFEDDRVDAAAFNALRGGPGNYSDAVPLGQLPVVTIGGRVFVESVQVSRWAARQIPAGAPHQLYPSDALAALVVDEVLGVLDEAWSKLPNMRQFPDAAELKPRREAWAADVSVRFFKHIERRLAEAGGPFVLGAEPSLADVWLLAFAMQVPNYDYVPPGLLDAYPAIARAVAATRAHDVYKKFGEPN